MSLLIWLLRKEREAEWKKNRAGTAGILILTGKRYWKAGWQENTVMGVSFVKADISAAYCLMTKSWRCWFVRAIVGIANRQMI